MTDQEPLVWYTTTPATSRQLQTTIAAIRNRFRRQGRAVEFVSSEDEGDRIRLEFRECVS